MKINKFFVAIVSVFALGVAATSCSHDDLELYHGIEAGIYIQEANTWDYYTGNIRDYRNETSPISFTNLGSAVEYTASFTVRLMGEIKNYDRPYILKVDKEKSTAVEGEDFDISSNDFSIKAGKASDVVNVLIKRNEHCRQKTLYIYFNIEPNENFIIPFEEYRKNTNWYGESDTLRSTSWKITYSEMYTVPKAWREDYFGPWTMNKYFELNRMFDLTTQDWDEAAKFTEGAKIGGGRMRYCTLEFQKYLQRKADEGEPVLDDDGSYMQLAPDFRVDYSAYGTNL